VLRNRACLLRGREGLGAGVAVLAEVIGRSKGESEVDGGKSFGIARLYGVDASEGDMRLVGSGGIGDGALE